VKNAAVYVPGLDEMNLQDNMTNQGWIREGKQAKKKITNVMRRKILQEKRERIKHLIDRLWEEGDRNTKSFYSWIQNKLWGKRTNSV
jgi:hypothetical protein